MDYVYTILILIGLFVILASSFDLVIGYCGLIWMSSSDLLCNRRVCFGDAGQGSRSAGSPGNPLRRRGRLCLIRAGSIAILARVSGDYLLIASIGFQLLGLIELAKHIHSIGGAGGLTNIPPFQVSDYGRFVMCCSY